MTSPSIRSKPCPTCADPCEPGTSVAVSVKSTLKTKSTATKPVKCTVPKEHRLLGKVRKLVCKKPVTRAGDQCVWPSSEVLLCNVLAWIGALVIAGVVFRSLYVMYCKPDEV